MIRTSTAAAALASLALAGTAAAQDVAYEVDGTAVEGYFAKAGDAPKGLVVLIHDWDGLGDYERQRADMLAEAGYDAFAIDVFGAGNRPETPDARIAAMQAAFADPEKLRALVLGGIAEARAHSAAEAAVLAGYCFGGAVTLGAARGGAPEGVAGFATFHAALPDGPAWQPETPPILIMHGGADKTPDMGTLAAYVTGMEDAGLTYDVEVYSGAPHAFTVFGSDNYRERADQESWAAFQRFLESSFAAG